MRLRKRVIYLELFAPCLLLFIVAIGTSHSSEDGKSKPPLGPGSVAFLRSLMGKSREQIYELRGKPGTVSSGNKTWSWGYSTDSKLDVVFNETESESVSLRMDVHYSYDRLQMAHVIGALEKNVPVETWVDTIYGSVYFLSRLPDKSTVVGRASHWKGRKISPHIGHTRETFDPATGKTETKTTYTRNPDFSLPQARVEWITIRRMPITSMAAFLQISETHLVRLETLSETGKDASRSKGTNSSGDRDGKQGSQDTPPASKTDATERGANRDRAEPRENAGPETPQDDQLLTSPLPLAIRSFSNSDLSRL